MKKTTVSLNTHIVVAYIIANIILFASQLLLFLIVPDMMENLAFLGFINLIWGGFFTIWLIYHARIYLCINQWSYIKSNPPRAIIYTVLGFIALVVIALGSNLILIHLFGLEIDPQNQQHIIDIIRSGPLGFISMITYAIILAPIIEELVFRKGVFELIYKRFGVIAAILGNSVLFGLIHVMFEFMDTQTTTQYINIVPYIIPGIVLSIIYYRSGKLIIIPIVIHMLYNAMGIFAIIVESFIL